MKIKKINIEKETKTLKVGGKTLVNESLEFQDRKKVRYLVGPFAGVVEELPELKANRMVKAKKAEFVIDKTAITPDHEIQRKARNLNPKKDETGKGEKKN